MEEEKIPDMSWYVHASLLIGEKRTTDTHLTLTGKTVAQRTRSRGNRTQTDIRWYACYRLLNSQH